MGFTLIAKNYRVLRNVRIALDGVCVLVGPNGAGKTTLLNVPALLRLAYEVDSFGSAIAHFGGAWYLRNLDAKDTDIVALGVELSERVEHSSGEDPGGGHWEDFSWEVQLEPGGASVQPLSRERVEHTGEILAFRDAGSPEIEMQADLDGAGQLAVHRIEARGLVLRAMRERVGELTRWLQGYRVYGDYRLGTLRRNGSQQSSDLSLDPQGENVFAVLRNWRDDADDQRWRFVINGMRDAFPDLFRDLRFEVAGMTVTGKIITPEAGRALPVALAPAGLLTGLLHLCAAASAIPGGAIAIDEPENSLHPFAIRRLFETIKARTQEQRGTVLLATHSPVLIDQFREDRDRLFVLEPGQVAPRPVQELHDPEWLDQFSLGDLYAHGQIGGPGGEPA